MPDQRGAGGAPCGRRGRLRDDGRGLAALLLRPDASWALGGVLVPVRDPDAGEPLGRAVVA